MDQTLTHVTAVLDASTSITSMKEGVIEGFNAFFDEQAEAEGRMTATLYEFSSSTYGVKRSVRQKFAARSLEEEVPQLTDETYHLGGRTPLYDAMIKAIDDTGDRLAFLPEGERPANVIVLVLTDGEENDSKVGSGPKGAKEVRQRVEHQQEKYSWEFVFLGADQDAILEASKIGIKAASALNYSASDEGTKKAMRSTSQAVMSMRIGDADDVSYEADDALDASQNS